MPNRFRRGARERGERGRNSSSVLHELRNGPGRTFLRRLRKVVDRLRQDERRRLGALTSEFMNGPKQAGMHAVALSFLAHPVRTILRLTDDPTYRSHWSFLTACVGAQLTLVYVILPRVYSALFNTPNGADSSAVITNEIVQYVGMAIMTPIQFYICRALGSIPRSPMSYVKLCVLSVSYCTLLGIITAFAYFGIVLADAKAGSVLDLGEVWQALNVANMAAILVFVTLTHRRFWGLSWLRATAVTVAIAIMSWVVVYPGLTTLLEKANIGKTISSLTG